MHHYRNLRERLVLDRPSSHHPLRAHHQTSGRRPRARRWWGRYGRLQQVREDVKDEQTLQTNKDNTSHQTYKAYEEIEQQATPKNLVQPKNQQGSREAHFLLSDAYAALPLRQLHLDLHC